MLPGIIWVGPHGYRVWRDNARIVEMARLRNGVPDCGYTDLSRQEIVLRETLAPGFERETLLHEVLHACAAFVGLSDRTAPEGRYTEEEFIAAIVGPLLGVLQDNPNLVEYLTGAPQQALPEEPRESAHGRAS